MNCKLCGWVVHGGVFDRDGGKKEGRGRKSGVVHLLWPLSGDHHHQQCEMETGHRNDLTNLSIQKNFGMVNYQRIKNLFRLEAKTILVAL